MHTLEELPQTTSTATVSTTDETLRMIERRLDSLSELIETEQQVSRIQPLSLAGYRRGVAKEIDQAMAETQSWWRPSSA